jgi:hypothetical protein
MCQVIEAMNIEVVSDKFKPIREKLEDNQKKYLEEEQAKAKAAEELEKAKELQKAEAKKKEDKKYLEGFNKKIAQKQYREMEYEALDRLKDLGEKSKIDSKKRKFLEDENPNTSQDEEGKKDQQSKKIENEQNNSESKIKQFALPTVVALAGTTAVVFGVKNSRNRKRDEKQANKDNKNNIKYQNKGINDWEYQENLKRKNPETNTIK